MERAAKPSQPAPNGSVTEAVGARLVALEHVLAAVEACLRAGDLQMALDLLRAARAQRPAPG